MAPRFEIVEGQVWHCGQMMRSLRYEHQSAIFRLGVNGHRGLREAFDASWFRRAWLIDGALAGLGGVTGSFIGSHGHVWLALSQAAMRHPLEIVREGRRQIDLVMRIKTTLTASVLDTDEPAKRFAAFMGFGPPGMARPVSRDGRRLVLREIETNPDYRHPIGSGAMVALCYNRELV